MGVFTQVDRIDELARELQREVQRRFWEVVESDARVIAEELISEKGLDDVCRDIDEALDNAEPHIHYMAESNATYYIDNWLLATFAPREAEDLVDEELVRLSVCEKEEFSMDDAVTIYAIDMWRNAIREKLKEILREKCAKVGLLGKLRAVIRR